MSHSIFETVQRDLERDVIIWKSSQLLVCNICQHEHFLCYSDLESSDSEDENDETEKQESTENEETKTSKQKKGILKNFKEDLKVLIFRCPHVFIYHSSGAY